MTNRPKSIADALAEVQHKVNEERRMRLAKMAETYLDEAGKADTVKAFFSSITKKKPAPGTPGVGPQPEFNTPKPVAGTGAQPGYNSPVGSGQPASGAKPAPSSMAPEGKPGAAQPDYNTPKPVAGTGPQPGAPAPTPSTSVPSAGSRTAAPTPSSTAVSAAADDAKKVTKIANGVGAVTGAGIIGAGVMATKGNVSPTANAASAPVGGGRSQGPGGPTNQGERDAAAANRTAPAPVRSAPKAAPAAPRNPDPQNLGSFSTNNNSKYGYAAPGSDEDTAANFFASSKRQMADRAGNGETEDGGKSKGKKKMSESTMIDAFLALQNTKAGNVFEAAKKLKGNQDKLDKNHNDKLDKQDFKMLRGEKMEEDVEHVEEERMSKGRKDALARKTSFTADPPRKLEPEPKKTKSEKIKDYRADRDKNGEMEESIFSEAELEHIASILEINDQSVSARQLTDEETEAPAKRGRGRPAGSRSGSTYGDEGPAEPKRVAAQIRDVKSYFNDDKKEVVKVTHPTKGSTHEVGIKAANDFNRDYASAGKPAHKDAVEAAFVKKHMGG